MNSVASVKDRLANKSRETGKTMEQLLIAYGLERTLFRISISPFAEKFTLKGGIFLYAIFGGNYARATTDIDFLAENLRNNTAEIKEIFSEILSCETDDPLVFDIQSINIRPIAEFKDYPGMNVSTTAYLGKTRIPISIDIGFGDSVLPKRTIISFPTVLGEKRPVVFAYSIESCLAEKLEALISLGKDNSRLKDFYDLYVLLTTHDFTGHIIKQAIMETFKNRGTSIPENFSAFMKELANNPQMISRWNSFSKRKRAMLTVSLQETTALIDDFISPVIVAAINGSEFKGEWIHSKRRWEE
ncbi:MAG: nucleotidyl transferase AbiEii/AbiGii toxin family protein [Erysipelotrichaceae bacterium]|nr:nucleotidyl transferase AbiEii/AbiGii toxin family protein [Erysipelotrichaceae bacterium]